MNCDDVGRWKMEDEEKKIEDGAREEDERSGEGGG
jgi:hypothetical protein